MKTNECKWIDCWNCGGTRYTHHDCGEDVCAYIDPEDNVVCEICNGEGGWYEVCLT